MTQQQHTGSHPQPAEQQPSSAEPARSSLIHTGQGLMLVGLIVLVIAAACAAAVNIGLDGVAFKNEPTRIAMTYALFLPAALLGVLGVALTVAGAVRWAMFGRGGERGRGAKPAESTAHAGREIELLESINRRILLSETAKRLAYRLEDIEALRQTIRKDVDQGDYDAALVLVNQMADTYGSREEAEEFREQILAARQAEVESKVSKAISRLEELLDKHEFHRAASEANKIQRLYPESPRVQSLPQRVQQARAQYKHDLERQFLAAAERDDVDRAMDLLKELDKYLTEQEAEPFRETARGVIGKKRDNLGVQFKLAVQDREWQKAVRVGEQILREFPNTRMADEVRGRIDVLRQRSTEQQQASAGRPARPDAPGAPAAAGANQQQATDGAGRAQ